MNVLGIHDGHNASAVLLRDGRIIAGVQEERPRGVKNALGLPREAIQDVLSQGGLTPAQIDWVALSGLHSGEYLDFDRSVQPWQQILQWHQALYDQPPFNVKRFVRRLIPDPIYESLRGDRVRQRRLDVVEALGFRRDRIRLVEHHPGHAASAYYGWGKLDEPILILDMIKKRDFWMPFAPSVTVERVRDYIRKPKDVPAPYMILAFDSVPEKESVFPAGIHPYDRTARPQEVMEQHNPSYHRLIRYYRDMTGEEIILNTSFNVHGLPIAYTPQQALATLNDSGLQHLAIGGFLISKQDVSSGANKARSL